MIGIHNATDGTYNDLLQSRKDKSLIDQAREGKSVLIHDGRNAAVDSLDDVIVNSVKDGNPPQVWAHSQGGAIASLASYDANNELIQNNYLQGINGLEVDSYGSAAQSWPSGISGEHYIHAQDGVPIETGLGGSSEKDSTNTGPNQTVIRFTGVPPNLAFPTAQDLEKVRNNAYAPQEDWTKYHDINLIYLPAKRARDGGCSPDEN